MPGVKSQAAHALSTAGMLAHAHDTGSRRKAADEVPQELAARGVRQAEAWGTPSQHGGAQSSTGFELPGGASWQRPLHIEVRIRYLIQRARQISASLTP